jgi:hypothetical protein
MNPFMAMYIEAEGWPVRFAMERLKRRERFGVGDVVGRAGRSDSRWRD